MQKRKDSRPIYTRVSPPSKRADRFPPPRIAPLHLGSLPSTSERSSPLPISRLHPIAPQIATSDGSVLSAVTPFYLRSLPSKSDRSCPPAIAPLHLQSLRVPSDRVCEVKPHIGSLEALGREPLVTYPGRAYPTAGAARRRAAADRLGCRTGPPGLTNF